jgi:hypothetical protein
MASFASSQFSPEQLQTPSTMFALAPLASSIGRRTILRNFATVGSQIPSVELHSE